MSQNVTYPVSPTLPSTTTAQATTLPPQVTGGGSFLGYGLLRPFRRDQKLDFAAAGGSRLVASAVGQVLGTRGASDFTSGELPWRDEFGSLLYLLRHRPNDDTTRELARIYVGQALVRWEPRIRVTGLEVESEEVAGLGEVAVAIRLRFDVIGRNSPGNAVILPGLETTVPLE